MATATAKPRATKPAALKAQAGPGRPAAPRAEDARISANGLATVRPNVPVVKNNRAFSTWDSRYCTYFNNPEYVPDEEKRLMLTDPQIQALLAIRRAAVLIDGVQINPQEGLDEADPRYAKSKELADFWRWTFCNTANSFHGALFQLLQADWWQYVAADLQYREQEWGRYKGKLCLDWMRPLSRYSYRIRLDDYGRVIGLEDTTSSADRAGLAVYPIEKFCFTSFRPDAERPVGTDLCAGVRTPWYMKNQSLPEQLANYAQFGRPSLWATAPSTVREVPLLDADGIPVDPEELVPVETAMKTALQNFSNGSAIVVPFESQLHLLEAQGDGRIWTNATDGFDWQMAVGILGTGNMQMRQKYGSNATAQTGAETVSIPIVSDKTAMADDIKKQLGVPLTHYNYPESYWDCLPTVTLGDARQDWWDGIAKAVLPNSGMTDTGMLTDINRRVGLRVPDPDKRIEPAASQPGAAVPQEPKGTVPDTAGTPQQRAKLHRFLNAFWQAEAAKQEAA